MNKLDENYYLRKCFFEREQVPTQSLMRKKMCESLAKVYFKSMTPKLKVLAGLEPPLRGGGNDWYMLPDDLLKGKTVLKPFQKAYLSQLGFNGIKNHGDKLVADERREMETEKERQLKESDSQWKINIARRLKEIREDTTEREAKNNTKKIKERLHDFEILFVNSFTKIETLMNDAALNEVEKVRQETFLNMQDRFEKLIKEQATMLYDKYEDKLEKEKARLKEDFIQNLEKARKELGTSLHDINVDKHVAVEKLRHILECQNVACQVYVALKEQEAHEQETEEIKRHHKKAVKLLSDEISRKEEEIKVAQEKQEAAEEYKILWKKKVCHVVKRFQMFVSYCLRNMPEYAEFFINMEKLMMIQVSKAIEDPEAENIFVPEEDTFHTPVPRPKPFVLVGDFGYKPELDQKLCPKISSSNTSHLPVVLVNKRCIYAACDNIKVFSDKVEQFINDNLQNDIVDDHDYSYSIPVKYTESQRIEDLKLEGSLMQIVQKEIQNIKGYPIPCCQCKLSICICSETKPTQQESFAKTSEPTSSQEPSSPSLKLSHDQVLKHEREPKYFPDICECRKLHHKMFHDYLPPYMKTISKYGPPILPNYEPCSVATMRMLMENARNKPIAMEKPPVKTFRNACIQASEDVNYYALCNCFSDEDVRNFCRKHLNKVLSPEKLKLSGRQAEVLTAGSPDESYLGQSITSFTTDRAVSLRLMIDETPALEEIFNKSDCNFD